MALDRSRVQKAIADVLSEMRLDVFEAMPTNDMAKLLTDAVLGCEERVSVSREEIKTACSPMSLLGTHLVTRDLVIRLLKEHGIEVTDD